MSLSKARDLADFILKIGAVLALLGLLINFVERPNVVERQDFYQSFVDPAVASREFAARNVPFPDAFQVLVKSYDQINEEDLANMLDTTGDLEPIARICEMFKNDTEAAFGQGFCLNVDHPNYWQTLRYHGRAYERLLVKVNNLGWIEGSGGPVLIPPPHLSSAQLHDAVDALHAAEYAAGRVIVQNTGRADAIRVEISPPNGYSHALTNAGPFTLRPGGIATRWFENDRGGEPIREDRHFGIGWDNGKVEVPYREAVLVGVIGLAAFGAVLILDLRRARNVIASSSKPDDPEATGDN